MLESIFFEKAIALQMVLSVDRPLGCKCIHTINLETAPFGNTRAGFEYVTGEYNNGGKVFRG